MFTWFINLNNNMQALIACIFTWVFTIVGFMSVFYIKNISDKISKVIIGFTSGILFASVIFSLMIPVVENSNIFICLLGIMLGIIFIVLIENNGLFKDNINNKLLLALAFHNIPEGIIIGSTFCSLGFNNMSLHSALGILFSIGIQNIPDGVVSALPLINSGYDKKRIFFICFLVSIIEPISGIASIFLLSKYQFLLPFIFSFSIGFIMYMLINELIPSSTKDSSLASILFIIGFLIVIFVN